MSATRKTVCRLLALVAIVVAGAHPDSRLPITRFAEATEPCAQASGSPGAPGDDPGPMVAGTVTTATTGAPVVGATVRLFRCESGTPTAWGTDTTDANGGFEFSSLSGPDWYYAAVDLTGPLAGMHAASGTANPTSLIPVGDGQQDLQLSFEE